MKPDNFRQWLLAKDACSDALAFAAERDFDPVRIYEECPRGDWILWWVFRMRDQPGWPTTSQIQIAKGKVAMTVLYLFQDKYNDNRPLDAAAYADAAAAYDAAYAYAYATARTQARLEHANICRKVFNRIKGIYGTK